MTRSIVGYGAALITFLALDAVYLATIGGRLFKSTLGEVLAPSFVVTPAVLFYLIYPVGLVIFAIHPAGEGGRWTAALLMGALLGFFAYATYDLTNWATIRNWTPTLVVVDVAWGTLLSGAAAAAGFFAARAFGGSG